MAGIADFFEPESIAVFGASERPDSMGGMVLQNLVGTGYKGRLIAINLKGYDSVYSVNCQASLPEDQPVFQLAIVCVPPDKIPGALKHIAGKGVKSVMILTGGISRSISMGGDYLEQAFEAAREKGIRIIGPNAFGLLVPALSLNASYSHVWPQPGTTAFVGQSAAVGSALLDYAVGRGIGMSHFIALGAITDIDIAEVIDYLAADRRVKSILVNIEQFGDARKLMTALRAASRTKNVVAIRSGLNEAPPPGLKSRNRVDYRFFRRAGVLEVNSLDGLFNGLEILSRMKPMYFESLAIISNGLGTAMLARNTLLNRNGKLADLSILENDHKVAYPYIEEIGLNPLVLSSATSADDYSELLKKLDKVKSLGAILLVVSPNVRSIPDQLAGPLAQTIKQCRHMVLTCWIGAQSVNVARRIFDDAGLLNFDSPNDAVTAFMTMVHHERNQTSLRETPPESKAISSPELQEVKQIFAKAESEKRDYLSWTEARKVVNQYGFKLIQSNFNESFDGLVESVKDIDFPISLRLVHEKYCYPFAYDQNPRLRWRAVAIQIENREQMQSEGQRLITEQQERFPDSKILGFSSQAMKRKIDSLVFSIGITRDELVGPLLLFGEGGSAADILADRRFALPPLNANHARKLIYRSHAYSVLNERSQNPEKDVKVLVDAMKSLSQMVTDHSELKGLEANLLLMPGHQLVLLGVAIQIGEPKPMPIAPYPGYLQQTIKLKNGQSLLLRPILAEDEVPLKAFFESMTPESLRYRFFGSRLQFEHRELAAMCQIDYVREMAFVAVDNDGRIWGEVRTWQDVIRSELEFAVMVDPGTQGQGFGTQLMQRMIAYGKDMKVSAIFAEVMSDNEPMIRLSRAVGFKVAHNEDGVITVRLEL